MTLTVDITSDRGGFVVSALFAAGGGVTVLRAPSGAGKSIILNTIAGLIRPRTGTIRFNTLTFAEASNGVHMRTQDRRIGMVFQHAALLPHRSPIDNVALGLRSTLPRRQQHSEALARLAEVDATDLAHAATDHLSGGEQQRVALARALAGDPQLLLLDEPFGALDHSSRVALRRTLRRVVDEHNIPALLVTHDSEDVQALADVVIDLEPGRFV
jgi:molybdate transport system ATP-binding protein